MASKQAIKLADKLIELNKNSSESRTLVGIVGPPGAGKTTMSEELKELVNQEAGGEIAQVVAMDGFHLSNERLEELGILPLKGIPDSFDRGGFEKLLKKVKRDTQTEVFFPLFDRSIEATIPNAGSIRPEHTIAIVEGNYLLVWHQIRSLLDYSIFLDVPEEILFKRLVRRHMEGGKDYDSAKDKALSTDMPNRKLVLGNVELANEIVVFQNL